MMAAKVAHPLNGAHTAGIYGDSTVDGPEIGTLVVIVDRAKNLPNRKTIGKQDPYCAARLGKEAKKTATDIRGGQTPRWDQELRFTVHDSSDYYSLKLSVFNDDRKAELIGETWIELKNIIVAGGGQADLWQSLSARGKYSGEIRIEITYYDTRKPERTERAYRQAPQQPVEQQLDQVMEGSMPMRGLVKRRPLPTDPLGPREPPAPSHRGSHTSLRKQPSYPSQADFGPPPPMPPPQSQRHAQTPADPYGTSPGWQNAPPPLYPSSHRMAHSRSSDFGAMPMPQQQQQQQQPQYQQQQHSHHPSHQRQQHPQYHQQRRNIAHARSTDFGQPEQRDRAPQYQQFGERRQPPTPDMYGMNGRSNGFPPDSSMNELHLDSDKPPPPPVHRTRHNSAAAQEAMMRNGGNQSTYDPSPRAPMHMRYGVLKQEAHRQSMAHGSRSGYRPYDPAPSESMTSVNGSVSGSDYSHHSLPRTGSLDTTHPDAARSMQPTVEDAPESPQTWSQATFPHNNRHSVQRSSLIYEVTPDLAKAATPAPLNLSSRNSVVSRQSNPSVASLGTSPHPATNGNFSAPPRPSPQPQEHMSSAASPLARTPTTYHYSYTNNTYSQTPSPTTDQAPSPSYDSQYGSSPGGAAARRGSFIEHGMHNDPYSQAMVPARGGSFAEQQPAYTSYTPQTPSTPAPARRGSFVEDGYDGRLSHSPAPLARRGSYVDEHTYDSPHARSPVPARRPSYVEDDGSGQRGNSPLPGRSRRNSAYESYENALVHLPSAPPSLVPGVDPESAQEIANRLKRLNSQFAAATATTRGRSQTTDSYPSSLPYRHDRGPSPSPYSPSPYTPNSFDGRSPAYDSHSPAPAGNGNRMRGRSPSPMPSPVPSPMASPMPPQSRMGRNSVSPAPPLSTSPGFSTGGIPFGPDSFDALNPSRGGSPIKSDGGSKIISHDGREVDPSDHLPMESWAPEPDAKPGQGQERSGATRSQSPLPPPPSGRRQLRISHRPSVSSSSVFYQPDDRATPLPPPGPGRGRLQKKSSRTLPPSPSPGPPSRAPTHSHSHSQGNNGYRDPQPSPRAVPRTTTWDYANDNMGSVYGTSPGVGGGSFAHRSTISGPPAPPRMPTGPVAPTDWALMQEINQIDLGAGRSSRRHRGY